MSYSFLNVTKSFHYNGNSTGTMGLESINGSFQLGRGTLYMLNDTTCFQKLEPVVPNVSISNGLAWNDDNTRMFYIDSMTRQIALFDYDPGTASICNFKKNYILFLKCTFNRYNMFYKCTSKSKNVLRFQYGQNTGLPGRNDNRCQW